MCSEISRTRLPRIGRSLVRIRKLDWSGSGAPLNEERPSLQHESRVKAQSRLCVCVCVCVWVIWGEASFGPWMPKLGTRTAPSKVGEKTQQDNWFGDCMISLSEEEREGT
jgi:hypothetical protein